MKVLSVDGEVVHVWVVTGETDGGDMLTPTVFSHMPTPEEKEELAWKHSLPYDVTPDNPAEGDFGSYVFMDVSGVDVVDNAPDDVVTVV
jgi:hypothetical protein